MFLVDISACWCFFLGMPRVARIVVTKVAHHITQRSNDRQDVFFVDDDRLVYLELLRKNCEKYEMRVHGYCVMMNHIDEQQVARLRMNTHTGRPLGSDSFLSRCEKFIGHRIRSLNRQTKEKEKNKAKTLK
jgi:hypothetical protein